MTNWKYWDDNVRDTVNSQLGSVEHCGKFLYPSLRDEFDLILASDYSGEHATAEFQVFGFLLTHQASVFRDWEAARLAVRRKYLADGRRIAFKELRDARRINALHEFLEAASLLNGVLVCVAVEKNYSLRNSCSTPPLHHAWTPNTLEKLLRICVYGGGFVDGLRGPNQDIFWITDDDEIVATQNATTDAARLMSGFIHSYPEEKPTITQGIASGFDDDLRAEDLLAISDLAAGAYSEALVQTGKSNIPTVELGSAGPGVFLRTKSAVIEAWRMFNGTSLKHFNTLVRQAENGQVRISFGQPEIRFLLPGQVPPSNQPLDEKWRRALTEALKRMASDAG